MMAVCTDRCRKCQYQKKFVGGCEGGMIYCDYICMEEHPRPCPAGEECTEFREKEAPWSPTPITIEPKKRGRLTGEAKAARRKEQVRVNARRYYERHREKALERQKQWRQNHRETVNASARAYRARQKAKKEAQADG